MTTTINSVVRKKVLVSAAIAVVALVILIGIFVAYPAITGATL